MKHLSAFVLFVAGLACGTSPVMAENTPSSASHSAKKVAAKKAAAEKTESIAHDNDEPDVRNLQATAFDCELGNKLTVYGRTSDDEQIALQWNKRLHRMTRVSTTTGAQRFENAQNGLVWIGIPAKSMLLDSKKGKQLANECKSKDQSAPQVADKG